MLPKKILLAEDDRDDSEFFAAFLKTHTDAVLLHVAENGEEVLEYLRGTSNAAALPDLVILDQNMPKRNGLQTVQALKESDAYKKIPVFVYSTYADELLKQRSTEAGAIAVFPKPYTPEGYAKMMDAMLTMLG